MEETSRLEAFRLQASRLYEREEIYCRWGSIKERREKICGRWGSALVVSVGDCVLAKVVSGDSGWD